MASLQELNVKPELVDEAAGVLMGVRPLFDPARYKGKIDVDKIQKSATTDDAQAKAPACCGDGCSVQ